MTYTWLNAEEDRVREDQTGQYSAADVQAAEGWRITHERRWTGEVRALASQRQAETRDKQNRLYDQMREAQKAADENLRALDAGDLAVPAFMNAAASLVARADEYERRIEGLESAQSIIDQMLGDPVGFQDSMFDKWQALQRLRPSVDQWIHEARERRRAEQRKRTAK